MPRFFQLRKILGKPGGGGGRQKKEGKTWHEGKIVLFFPNGFFRCARVIGSQTCFSKTDVAPPPVVPAPTPVCQKVCSMFTATNKKLLCGEEAIRSGIFFSGVAHQPSFAKAKHATQEALQPPRSPGPFIWLFSNYLEFAKRFISCAHVLGSSGPISLPPPHSARQMSGKTGD